MLDILTNPNVAYLILVLGVLLAMIAVVTPGTGVIEVAALLILTLAGYEMIILSINYWALALLVIGVFPFLIAVRRSRQLRYLVISIAAFVVGSAFLFDVPGPWPAVNPFLALITSVLAAGFIWIATTKALEAFEIKPTHNVSNVVGLTGETKTTVHQKGSVYVAGELWSARSPDLIPEGTRIKVIAMEGFMLDVVPFEPIEQGK
jgi:membrane-bound ClpP family serine protease